MPIKNSPFRSAESRVNIPASTDGNMRIIGYKISADEAKLSHGIEILEKHDAKYVKLENMVVRLVQALNDLHPYANRNSKHPLKECSDEFDCDYERKKHLRIMLNADELLNEAKELINGE